jgi:RNA polymerase sigma factor (sigma-70 family)
MGVNNSDHESQDILPRLASGDSAALKDYITKYGRFIRLLTWQTLRLFHEEEDIAEEILIEVIDKSPKFDRTETSEEDFVQNIARRYLQSHYRQCKECRLSFISLDESPIDIQDNRVNIEKAFENAERIELVTQQLSVKENQIFKLFFIQELSMEEISGLLNISPSMVRKMKYRLLIKVRKLLSESAVSTTRQSENTIENDEAILSARISNIFPLNKRQRYDELYVKFQQDEITEKEYAELVKLSEEFEYLNAKRLRYISELAEVRGTSIEETVKEFHQLNLI